MLKIISIKFIIVLIFGFIFGYNTASNTTPYNQMTDLLDLPTKTISKLTQPSPQSIKLTECTEEDSTLQLKIEKETDSTDFLKLTVTDNLKENMKKSQNTNEDNSVDYFTTAKSLSLQQQSQSPDITQVVIETLSDEMQQLNTLFDGEQRDSEWSYQYENKVLNYLSQNENAAINYLVCKTQYCRLEIEIYNKEKFLAQYRQMTSQDWWETTAFWSSADTADTRTIFFQRMSVISHFGEYSGNDLLEKTEEDNFDDTIDES